MKLYFLTGNKNKLLEAKSFIPNIEGLELELTEVQSLDPHEIIKHKLEEARKIHSGNFIVEDTSLTVECLNGLPGPLIKFFEKSIGLEGIVKITKAFGDNKAVAKCLIGLSSDGNVKFFEGNINGKIVDIRGENGFGWDKIFVPEGYKETFAEMKREDKNKISMRKIAFEELKEYLDSHKNL